MAYVEAPSGAKIRAARKVLGMSQAQVACAVGVCAECVSRWERGKSVVKSQRSREDLWQIIARATVKEGANA